MRWFVGWIPVIINVLIIFAEPVAILFIPFSFLLGMIVLGIYSHVKMHEYEEGTYEYNLHKKDRDEAIIGVITGGTYLTKKTGKCIKDIADVDHWNTKI